MRRHTVRMVLFLVLGILLGSERPASAVADVNELVGRWNGFIESVGNPDIRGPVTIDISSTSNRRFVGVAKGIHDPEIKIEGTLSASGILNIESTEKKVRLRAHGSVRSVSDPNIVGDPQIRIAGISFDLLDAAGKTVDRGTLVLMQMDGGPAWETTPGEPVTGPWGGDLHALLNPCIFAQLKLLNLTNILKLRTTAVAGTATLLDVMVPGREDAIDLSLDLGGTVGVSDPDIMPGIGLIGSDAESGIIAILVGLVRPAEGDEPARIEADLLLFEGLPEALDWTSGEDSYFDIGDIYLPFDGGITYQLVTDIPGEILGSSVAGTITFPWWSVGSSTIDADDVVSYDIYVVGYSPAGPGWSSNDAAVVAWGSLEFAPGATIGDPVLLPHPPHPNGDDNLAINFVNDAPMSVGIPVKLGLYWTWAYSENYADILDVADYASWHLERCPD